MNNNNKLSNNTINKVSIIKNPKNTGVRKTQEEVAQLFEERDCKLIGAYINNQTPIEYICKCGNTRNQRLDHFLKNQCRFCLKSVTEEETVIPDGRDGVEDTIDEQTGEMWKRVLGGWVSSFGRAKSMLGNLLTLDVERSSYFINKRHISATKLVAQAFKIENYDKLESREYITTHLDGDKSNNRVDNLKVIHRRDVDCSNYKKMDLEKDVDVTGLEYKVISMFPKYKIYENGEIFNGKRFFKFNCSRGYLKIGISKNGEKEYLRVHRIVCYAFHPIEGLHNLEDYKHLQVNHKDNNKLNNHKNNLEWVTRSENINHAYKYGHNRKSRAVFQLEKDGTEILGEYYSIAEAVRQTSESKSTLQSFLKGKRPGSRKYDWKYVEEDKREEESSEGESLEDSDDEVLDIN